MASAEMIGICIILGTLLVAPPIGILAMRQIRSRAPAFLRTTQIFAVVTITMMALCVLLKIRWLSDLMNISSIALAYLAYCLIFGYFWTTERSVGRSKLVEMTAIPIVLGYLFATVGGLGVAWIVGETLGVPGGEISPAPGLLCRQKSSDKFVGIVVYRYFPMLPFIGQEQRRVPAGDTGGGGRLTNANCKHAAKSVY